MQLTCTAIRRVAEFTVLPSLTWSKSLMCVGTGETGAHVHDLDLSRSLLDAGPGPDVRSAGIFDDRCCETRSLIVAAPGNPGRLGSDTGQAAPVRRCPNINWENAQLRASVCQQI